MAIQTKKTSHTITQESSLLAKKALEEYQMTWKVNVVCPKCLDCDYFER